VAKRVPKNDDRFVTLDEGLKAGTVEVFEKGAATNAPANRRPTANQPNYPIQSDNPFDELSPANNQPRQTSAAQSAGREQSDVNSLMVLNKSNKPLYLMPGEIIIGGRQDRTIAREVVIPPSKTPTAIDVFCVEHGRWGTRDDAEYSSYLSAATENQARAASVAIQAPDRTSARELTMHANSGKFIGSVGSLNKASRLAVQKGEGQQSVWEEVSKENAKGGVKADSGAFTGNYAESDAVKRLEPYIERLQNPVAKTENVVGVIVAVNGKVESMDVFESSPLFKKLWPKLLKSYALDATNAPQGKAPAKVATRDDAERFLQEVSTAKPTSRDASGSVAVSRGENERVLLFSAHEERDRRAASASSEAAVGGLGGFGGGIHGSAFAK
jgi:ARG/rhodanese/phosphatase superfamily protein